MLSNEASCQQCGLVFVFERARGLRNGKKAYCSKKCRSKRDYQFCAGKRKQWALDNPDKTKAFSKKHYLKVTHNITPEDLNTILETQDNRCALCYEKLGEDIHIDHDHTCCAGKKSCGNCIRGVLHPTCNSGIGMFKDNPVLCRLAAAYLERDQSRGISQ